eukprot:scaffold65110_cov57-Attheya_sp.AAC.1
MGARNDIFYSARYPIRAFGKPGIATWTWYRYKSLEGGTPEGGITPTAGVLLGSGERAEGYVRRGIFYLEKSGCVPACVDVVQRWRP